MQSVEIEIVLLPVRFSGSLSTMKPNSCFKADILSVSLVCTVLPLPLTPRRRVPLPHRPISQKQKRPVVGRSSRLPGAETPKLPGRSSSSKVGRDGGSKSFISLKSAHSAKQNEIRDTMGQLAIWSWENSFLYTATEQSIFHFIGCF